MRQNRLAKNGGTTAPNPSRNQGRGGKGGQGQGKQPNPLTAPLTPKDVRRETRAATNLEYRPLERKLGGELRASNQRVKDVGNWWKEYLAQVSGLRSDTANAYAQAAAQGQGQIDQAAANDAANTQRLQAEEAASAALRGATPSNESAQREAAAQAQRAYLAAAQGGATAAQGANQYAYLTDRQRVGAGQSIASRREEQKRGISVRQDQRELAKQRGEFAQKYRGELRDKEREYQIKLRAFPLEKQKLQNEARNDEYQRLLEQKKQSETERHNRVTESHEGGRTPTQKREAKRAQRSADTTAHALYGAAKQKPQTPQEWQAFTLLVAKEAEGADQVNAKKAVQRLRQQLEAREGEGGTKGPGSTHR